MKIQEIVNDSKWQRLRESLVGTWKKVPVENCKKLRSYLGDFSDPLKVRRVHNYLTGSGFRIGVIRHKKIDELLTQIRKHRYESN